MGEDAARQVTIVAGDPVHDLLSLRRKVSAMAADGQDLLRDHAEVCFRLSAEEAGDLQRPCDEADVPVLSDEGKLLLKACVQQVPSKALQLTHKSPQTTAEVRSFLSHPTALTSHIWLELFGAYPPRGTFGRIAALLKTKLHKQSAAHGWRNKHELRQEIKKIRKWYKPGKKVGRVRKITRDVDRPPVLKGLRTAWNAKVAKHFRIFRSSIKLHGLWAWRQISRIYRDSGVPLQTGTVCVERTWSSLSLC